MTTAGYLCADCHGTVDATTHVNNAVTLTSGLTYAGGLVVGDTNFNSCSTGSCHNAAVNIAWNAVPERLQPVPPEHG